MSKIDGFKQIRHVSNWGDWELFGGSGKDEEDDKGEEIIDGSVMMIRWPDKTETKETVHYEKGTQTIHDMGHEYEGRDEYAYVDAKVRGIKIQLRIKGLHCKLLSVPKQAVKK